VDNQQEATIESETENSGESNKSGHAPTNHPVRRLLIFQLKLALDALRDILLSPVSILATLVDFLSGRQGDNSYFEMLLKLGRISERHINLFEQHQDNSQTVDTVVHQFEAVVKNRATSQKKSKNKTDKKMSVNMKDKR